MVKSIEANISTLKRAFGLDQHLFVQDPRFGSGEKE